MSLFTCVIEGRLTSSPERGHTRYGQDFVQFPIVYRDSYRDRSGKQVQKVMHFEVMCWGDLAGRAQHLNRGDLVIVEAGQLLAYVDHDRRRGDDGGEAHERCGQPVLKVSARNLSVSMRFDDAHAGKRPPSRRGDIVSTPDGEKYAADAYPEVVGDLELVHHH